MLLKAISDSLSVLSCKIVNNLSMKHKLYIKPTKVEAFLAKNKHNILLCYNLNYQDFLL